MEEKLQRFTQPLEPEEIEWKIQSKTKTNPVKTILVPYIDNRAVMNRLDNVFGSQNWTSSFTPQQYEVTAGKNNDTVKRIAMVCTLSILFGDKWISKQDGADGTDIETFKGGISDSMKRCATQWGLGRELYDYPKVFVEGDIKYIEKDILEQLREIDVNRDVIVLKPRSSNGYEKSSNKGNFAPKTAVVERDTRPLSEKIPYETVAERKARMEKERLAKENGEIPF